MRYLFLTLFLLFTSFVVCQKVKIDSLNKLINDHKINDTTKVDLLNTVSSYYTTNNILKNEAVLKEAIRISKQINNPNRLAKSYLNYSILTNQRGDIEKALQNALLARHIYDNLKDYEGLKLTNSSLAQIYIQHKKPKKAIVLQLENLSFFKNDSLNLKKARIHFYLATAYSDIKNYTEAEKHYKKAKHIALKNNFLTGVHIANSSLGVLARKQGDSHTAIKYLETALSYYIKHQQMANIAHTNKELAVAYTSINNKPKAISSSKKAIAIYKEQRNFKMLKETYLKLSYYYQLENNFRQSLIFFKKHIAIKDSLYNIQKLNAIEEMQAKYELEKIKNEKELAQQQNTITSLESKKNKNLFTAAIIISLLILSTSIFYFNKLKLKKQAAITLIELKETQKRLVLEKQYKDTELKALKAQMDPHFIFNSLNSIQEYILLNEKEIASSYLRKFSDLIRMYLNHSNIGYISVAEEIEGLQLYLALEAMRFEDKLSYHIQIDNNVKTETELIPTMLIQPYVENALKHGLFHKKENRLLNISFKQNSLKSITCIIEDNGIGRVKSKEINSKKSKLHKSFALEASKNRLALLNEKSKHRIGVFIEDLYDTHEQAIGTKVTLLLPLKKA